MELNERPWSLADAEDVPRAAGLAALRRPGGRVHLGTPPAVGAGRDGRGPVRPATASASRSSSTSPSSASPTTPRRPHPRVRRLGRLPSDHRVHPRRDGARVARHPACRLQITGVEAETAGAAGGSWNAGGWAPSTSGWSCPACCHAPSFSSSTPAAHGLLIPLFDDVRSTARFPTKIGEYLASGRPIVTTAVGEMPRYFEDGVTAFISAPDDPQELWREDRRTAVRPRPRGGRGDVPGASSVATDVRLPHPWACSRRAGDGTRRVAGGIRRPWAGGSRP